MSKSIFVINKKAKPKTDFWSLQDSLKSKISLSDKELKKARQYFSKKWTIL